MSQIKGWLWCLMLLPLGTSAQVIKSYVETDDRAVLQASAFGKDVAIGLHFVPLSDGVITRLGGLFSNEAPVSIYERETGKLLARTVIQGDNENFIYQEIQPLEVKAYTEYTLSMDALQGQGAYYWFKGAGAYSIYPFEHGPIEVTGAAYSDYGTVSKSRNKWGGVYGVVDFTFDAFDWPPTGARKP